MRRLVRIRGQGHLQWPRWPGGFLATWAPALGSARHFVEEAPKPPPRASAFKTHHSPIDNFVQGLAGGAKGLYRDKVGFGDEGPAKIHPAQGEVTPPETPAVKLRDALEMAYEALVGQTRQGASPQSQFKEAVKMAYDALHFIPEPKAAAGAVPKPKPAAAAAAASAASGGPAGGSAASVAMRRVLPATSGPAPGGERPEKCPPPKLYFKTHHSSVDLFVQGLAGGCGGPAAAYMGEGDAKIYRAQADIPDPQYLFKLRDAVRLTYEALFGHLDDEAEALGKQQKRMKHTKASSAGSTSAGVHEPSMASADADSEAGPMFGDVPADVGAGAAPAAGVGAAGIGTAGVMPIPGVGVPGGGGGEVVGTDQRAGGASERGLTHEEECEKLRKEADEAMKGGKISPGISLE